MGIGSDSLLREFQNRLRWSSVGSLACWYGLDQWKPLNVHHAEFPTSCHKTTGKSLPTIMHMSHVYTYHANITIIPSFLCLFGDDFGESMGKLVLEHKNITASTTIPRSP